jgi:hypothetical protein
MQNIVVIEKFRFSISLFNLFFKREILKIISIPSTDIMISFYQKEICCLIFIHYHSTTKKVEQNKLIDVEIKVKNFTPYFFSGFFFIYC